MQSHSLALFLVSLVFVGCSNKAVVNTPEVEPRLEAIEPFFQEMVPGVEDGEVTIDLEIPLLVSPPEVEVDSVYFKGMKQKLRKTTAGESVIYKTKFYTRKGQKAVAPMEMRANDALVTYRYQGKRYLFKISGIIELEAIYAPSMAE